MERIFASSLEGELKFIRLFDFVEDLVFFMEVDGDNFRYRYINQAVKKLVGLDDTIIGHTVTEIIEDIDEADYLRNQYLRVVNSKEGEKFTHTIKTKEVFYTGETTMYPLSDEEGKCKYVLAIVKDITEKYLLEKKLIENEERFRIITENSLDVIKLINPDGIVTYSSPTSHGMVGLSPEAYIGKHMLEFIADEHKAMVEKKFKEMIREGKPVTVEMKNRHKDGHYIWQEVVATPIFHEGIITQIVTSARDISERIEYREKLAKMAFYDYLSDLPNRRFFDDRLEMAILRAQRFSTKVGLILLDGRNFKKINDTFGHGIGDELIVVIARKLEKNIREIDTVGRLGGDEFAIILPDIENLDDVLVVAKRTKREFDDSHKLDGIEIDFKLDMGISVFPDHALDKKSLIHCADQALYTAKSNSDITYKVYTPEIDCDPFKTN